MTHADFEHSAVTDEARCGFLPMLAVMLGFTFFSASMVVGVAMFAVPTTMFLMDVSALQGSWWLAGGTLELAGTPPLPLRCIVPIVAVSGALMTSSAYFGMRTLKIVSVIAVPAIAVLGLNIWTTNDNAIYTAGLGLANITGLPKRHLVLVCGFLGTLSSVCLYAHFCGWLNILNVLIPPFGAIILSHLFLCRGGRTRTASPVAAVIAWTIGSFAALCGFGYLGWTLPGSGIPALDGMAVSAFVYCLLRRFDACKKVIGRPLCLSAGNGIILLFPKRQRPLLA